MKLFTTYLQFGGAVAFCSFSGWWPYELRYTLILAIIDPLRKLLKLNVEGIKLIMFELDFIVPFGTILMSGLFGMASFDFEFSGVMFNIMAVLIYTVHVLLGELIDSQRQWLASPSAEPVVDNT